MTPEAEQNRRGGGENDEAMQIEDLGKVRGGCKKQAPLPLSGRILAGGLGN
jgi:hypothetical protein